MSEPVTFVTYGDLARDVEVLDAKVPRNLVGVIGIPRSGMLPATMLALERNLPLSTPQKFAVALQAGKNPWLERGPRCRELSRVPGRVLVVDDACYMGSAMREARTLLNRCRRFDFSFSYAVVYRHERTPEELIAGLERTDVPLDYHAVTHQGRRYFEWNLFHHPDLKNTLLDIDGVLCEDPEAFDDGGEAYRKALKSAVPKHLPSVRMGGLITHRIERHRDVTAAWLVKHKLDYGPLEMCPAASADERRKTFKPYGKWKGECYRESEFELMIESDSRQAEIIAQVSGKPVICVEDRRVYQ